MRVVPGARVATAGLRRLAPGLHAWLLRRYLFYSDSSITVVAAAQRVEMLELDIDVQIALGWLRRIGANRVN